MSCPRRITARRNLKVCVWEERFDQRLKNHNLDLVWMEGLRLGKAVWWNCF